MGEPDFVVRITERSRKSMFGHHVPSDESHGVACAKCLRAWPCSIERLRLYLEALEEIERLGRVWLNYDDDDSNADMVGDFFDPLEDALNRIVEPVVVQGMVPVAPPGG